MSIVLSVYTVRMMDNYILPNINNSDYSVVLEADKFGFSGNIILDLQVIDGKWSIKDSKRYAFSFYDENGDGKYEHDINATHRILKDGDLISLGVRNEEKIKIIVSEVKLSLDSFRKFYADKDVRITIGRSPSNVIVYNIQNFIGREHAVIEYLNGAWFVTDMSIIGVFVRDRRVNKRQQLYPGDRISIYGLEIIYIYGIFAISALEDVINKHKGTVLLC